MSDRTVDQKAEGEKAKLAAFMTAHEMVRRCLRFGNLTMHEANALLGCTSRLQDLIACIEHAQKEKTT